MRRKLHEFFIIVEKWSIESAEQDGLTFKAIVSSIVSAGILIARIMANTL